MSFQTFFVCLITSLLLLGLPYDSRGQFEDITWQELSDVAFEDVWDENAEMNYQKPSFGENVKALEGEAVAITGYMIPVDINLDYYVLSAFPFASCFFCGGAGPESVLDLNFSEVQSFKNDEHVKVCGVLRLNDTDLYSLPFALDNAAPCP